MLAFIIQFTLFYLYSHSNIKFRISKIVRIGLIYSVIFLSLTLFLSVYLKVYGYFMNIGLLVIWILLFLNKEEKHKIKSYAFDLLKVK